MEKKEKRLRVGCNSLRETFYAVARFPIPEINENAAGFKKLIRQTFPRSMEFDRFELYAVNLGLADAGIFAVVPNDGIRQSGDAIRTTLKQILR